MNIQREKKLERLLVQLVQGVFVFNYFFVLPVTFCRPFVAGLGFAVM